MIFCANLKWCLKKQLSSCCRWCGTPTIHARPRPLPFIYCNGHLTSIVLGPRPLTSYYNHGHAHSPAIAPRPLSLDYSHAHPPLMVVLKSFQARSLRFLMQATILLPVSSEFNGNHFPISSFGKFAPISMIPWGKIIKQVEELLLNIFVFGSPIVLVSNSPFEGLWRDSLVFYLKLWKIYVLIFT